MATKQAAYAESLSQLYLNDICHQSSGKGWCVPSQGTWIWGQRTGIRPGVSSSSAGRVHEAWGVGKGVGSGQAPAGGPFDSQAWDVGCLQVEHVRGGKQLRWGKEMSLTKKKQSPKWFGSWHCFIDNTANLSLNYFSVSLPLLYTYFGTELSPGLRWLLTRWRGEVEAKETQELLSPTARSCFLGRVPAP